MMLKPYSPIAQLAASILPGATEEEIKTMFIDMCGIGKVRDEINKVYTDIKVINDSLLATLDELSKRKQVFVLPDVTIPPASLLTGSILEKTVPCDCVGILPTDRLEITPKNMPVNYGLRGYSITGADKISIKIQCPLLLSGGSPLVFGVTAFR